MTDLSNSLPRLTLDLGDGAMAFSTLRGDIRDLNAPYDGFNACHYTGDAPSHFEECRRQLSEAVGMPLEKIVIPRQSHSANVAILTSAPCTPLDDTDALVTARPDLLLTINTADCLPVVFNDPVNRIVGIAHAGWKGILNGIIRTTIKAMLSLGAWPQTIHAAIGPSICGNCYEVSPEFIIPFRQQFPDLDGLITYHGSRPHVDLAIAARSQIAGTAVPIEQIAMPPLCTRCNPSLFFSARILTPASGRILTAIKLV